jgi:hypothetical protein
VGVGVYTRPKGHHAHFFFFHFSPLFPVIPGGYKLDAQWVSWGREKNKLMVIGLYKNEKIFLHFQ